MYLDSDHHIKMALRILLNNIAYVVRLSSLLKFPPGHKVLDLSYGSDGISMGFSQAAKAQNYSLPLKILGI